MELYKEKKESYFAAANRYLLEIMPRNPNNKILEIGAGVGNTLLLAKELNLAKETVGVELVKLENSNQNHKNIDRFIIGNIEEIELNLEKDYFDVIIAGDVLEHLINPWNAVNKLSKHLKKGGVFVVTIPNIREFLTITTLIFKGDFKYSDTGILDKTHLRFFCKKNMIKLFENNNIKIQRIFSHDRKLRTFINKWTFGIFDEFIARKYFIIAQKI